MYDELSPKVATIRTPTAMKLFIFTFLILSMPLASAFVAPSNHQTSFAIAVGGTSLRPLCLSSEPQNDSDADVDMSSLTKEEKEQVVGNLVADDEWNGLTLELSELVRLSIVEDLKKNAREFLDKDDYKVGDIAKEVDKRVKNEVASLRGKEEYELGDLSIALDDLSKELTCELTGKENYEFGDLSKELDKRVKSAVADYCGKDTYELGDLSKEVSRRVAERVADFTGKEYEFGDITREIDERRKKWVQDYLGEEAAENYKFGDLTKKFLGDYTGKGDEYQFGDATKKFVGDLFGGKKKRKD